MKYCFLVAFVSAALLFADESWAQQLEYIGKPVRGIPVSSAVKVGKFVFVSGTPGYDKGKLAVGDFTAQMKQVMENISSTLKASGTGMERVVKINVLLMRAADFRRNEPHLFQLLPRGKVSRPYNGGGCGPSSSRFSFGDRMRSGAGIATDISYEFKYRPMSVHGTKRTCRGHPAISAIGGKADMPVSTRPRPRGGTPPRRGCRRGRAGTHHSRTRDSRAGPAARRRCHPPQCRRPRMHRPGSAIAP